MASFGSKKARTRITRSKVGQSAGQEEGGGTEYVFVCVCMCVCVLELIYTSICTDLASFGSTNVMTKIARSKIGQSAGQEESGGTGKIILVCVVHVSVT